MLINRLLFIFYYLILVRVSVCLNNNIAISQATYPAEELAVSRKMVNQLLPPS